MGWLIAALGTGLALGGTVAIYFGAPYMQVEWGYSEVIAGTTALSAGILAVALASILFALRDLKRLARIGGDGRGEWTGARPASASPTGASAPTVAVLAPTEPAWDRVEARPRHDEPVPFRPAEGGVPAEDQAATVVGRYEANGASYVLFSDGTIEVETETGTHRYGSMQELRAHIEQEEVG